MHISKEEKCSQSTSFLFVVRGEVNLLGCLFGRLGFFGVWGTYPHTQGDHMGFWKSNLAGHIQDKCPAHSTIALIYSDLIAGAGERAQRCQSTCSAYRRPRFHHLMVPPSTSKDQFPFLQWEGREREAETKTHTESPERDRQSQECLPNAQTSQQNSSFLGRGWRDKIGRVAESCLMCSRYWVASPVPVASQTLLESPKFWD